MPFVIPPAGSILDAMPDARMRLEDWLNNNRLASPHAELLRGLYEYTRTTPAVFVNDETSFSRHMAASLAQVSAALEVLDTTLLTVRARGSQAKGSN